MKASSIPVGYVDVNSNIYTIKMDLGNMPADDTGGTTGKIEAVATYTDENTWDINFLMTEMACDDSDARAPERIKILVSKAGGLWTGKAMFYNGIWLSEGTPTCAVAASNALSMNFYTDFVASDIAAKAKVYMMSRTKDSLDDIANYGMNSLSTNFPGAMGSPDTSTYINPFCNPANTLDADWSSDCTTLDPTVGAASYGSTTNWVFPSAFYQLEVTLPSAL